MRRRERSGSKRTGTLLGSLVFSLSYPWSCPCRHKRPPDLGNLGRRGEGLPRTELSCSELCEEGEDPPLTPPEWLPTAWEECCRRGGEHRRPPRNNCRSCPGKGCRNHKLPVILGSVVLLGSNQRCLWFWRAPGEEEGRPAKSGEGVWIPYAARRQAKVGEV